MARAKKPRKTSRGRRAAPADHRRGTARFDTDTTQGASPYATTPRASATAISSACPGHGEDFRILIDCGLHSGVKDGPDKIAAIAGDIVARTQPIDILVVTHEHWDHVSGFLAGRRFRPTGNWRGVG